MVTGGTDGSVSLTVVEDAGGTQFTCFTSTQIQTLTSEELLQGLQGGGGITPMICWRGLRGWMDASALRFIYRSFTEPLQILDRADMASC